MEQFLCKTKIIAGPGSMGALADLHIKRLLIVSDPFFYKNGTVNHVAHLSKAATVEVFGEVAPDPSVHLAARGAALVQRFQPDSIVALGGGSAMDCAKAMAYFSGSDAQLIAIPTTSGSGSEVTDFAILTHEGIKHPLVDEKLRPQIAILDGDLVQSLPQKLIAEGGFDLISHALESWVSTGAGMLTDALAFEALRSAFSLLPRSFAGDTSARMPLHMAATMAGIAFSQSGLGLCHAISHALGGEFHVPHGQLNAIVLPAVLDYNSAVAATRYAALSRRLGLSAGADPVALRALKNALLQLRRSLRLPQSLTQAGIDSAQLQAKLDSLTSAILADPCCATNPIKPDASHIHRILRQVTNHG